MRGVVIVVVVMLEERSVFVVIVLRGMCIRLQASQARKVLMATWVDIVGDLVPGRVDTLRCIRLRSQARWKHKRQEQPYNSDKIQAFLLSLIGLYTTITSKPKRTSGSSVPALRKAINVAKGISSVKKPRLARSWLPNLLPFQDKHPL